jgi:hypothetical protein
MASRIFVRRISCSPTLVLATYFFALIRQEFFYTRVGKIGIVGKQLRRTQTNLRTRGQKFLANKNMAATYLLT